MKIGTTLTSPDLALYLYNNTITVTVTAENGVNQTVYTYYVYRGITILIKFKSNPKYFHFNSLLL